MSAFTSSHDSSPHVRPLLSPQEAIARQLIVDRVHRRHAHGPDRRHSRTAAVLRRLAERLDPQPVTWQAQRRDGAPAQPSGIRPAGAC